MQLLKAVLLFAATAAAAPLAESSLIARGHGAAVAHGIKLAAFKICAAAQDSSQCTLKPEQQTKFEAYLESLWPEASKDEKCKDSEKLPPAEAAEKIGHCLWVAIKGTPEAMLKVSNDIREIIGTNDAIRAAGDPSIIGGVGDAIAKAIGGV
ncbi:hypothetical protein H072_273 [Dactylellina haptotyla CBS 200.50]|uniref:Uncharacterized protein n=1 Tax=Dactylellina haptotyla (strain CBS 200.50) TaxID=1284197 RepID=S8AXV9_DACHA|nr:hypothetical protein H072_273 [Dactylellina haptotyla CBS 200.50]